MRNELPEFYFFVLPDTAQLVTIRRNEHGYYHSDWSTDDKVRNQEIADFQNQKLGITPAQQQAMEVRLHVRLEVAGRKPAALSG